MCIRDSFNIVHSHASRYFRPPVFFPASSRASSTSTIILRPIWVIALSIFQLFLMRLAVGRLHPNSLAMPSIPYTYFLSVSVTGCGCASVWLEACLLRNKMCIRDRLLTEHFFVPITFLAFHSCVAPNPLHWIDNQ